MGASVFQRPTAAFGRLEATLATLSPDEGDGARERLVLIEVEAMLRAQGLMLAQGESGREMMEAGTRADPEAVRLARGAIRRLDGQGALADLPAFLGLHRRASADDAPVPGLDQRPRGDDFDAAAAEFLQAADGFAALIQRIRDWSARARSATAPIKGDNAARVIAVLAARPLVSAMEVEARAGVSRPTAERMLKRLTDLGLIREVTGHRRFRLWTAGQ